METTIANKVRNMDTVKSKKVKINYLKKVTFHILIKLSLFKIRNSCFNHSKQLKFKVVVEVD